MHIEEIKHEVDTVLDGEVHAKCTYHAYVILKDNFNELIQRDDLAYTRLVEGIEARMYLKPAGQRAKSRNSVLQDIIEKVVKPLYGKE